MFEQIDVLGGRGRGIRVHGSMVYHCSSADRKPWLLKPIDSSRFRVLDIPPFRWDRSMASDKESWGMTDCDDSSDAAPRSALGWKTLTLLVVSYVTAVLLATYPVVCTFTSRLPGSRSDPLQALRVMRWYKDSMLHGYPLLQCPGLQYPIGAPLGNFSPLHFQSFLYLPLSLAGVDDVLCYNLIWLFNLVFTGMGTFFLVWYVLRDRWCAGFAGLVAMLSGPVLVHALGHIELISLGWIPLFVVGWLRFVDQPTVRRLLLAAFLYIMVGASAAYFAVFAIIPAVCYLLWRGAQERNSGFLQWWWARSGWLFLFAALSGAFMCVLFYPQLWSRAHGYSVLRGSGEFLRYRVPLWGYVLPSSFHPLGRSSPWSSAWYDGSGYFTVESCSYLGVATWLLVGYAAAARVGFRRASFWWMVLLGCLVLSFGSRCDVFGHQISMPAGWLRHWFYPFRLIRAPARFNLLASIFAALVAAAGLRHFLGCLNKPVWRVVAFVAFCTVAMADLALVPFVTAEVTPMPACYEYLRGLSSQSTLLEAPQYATGECSVLNASCGYWQSRHQGKTTAGYSGYPNLVAEDLLYHTSPFTQPRLMTKEFLQGAEVMSFDVLSGIHFEDYVWLYLTVHRLDYVVVHKDPLLVEQCLPAVEPLRVRMLHARVFEDPATVVFDRRLLTRPKHPTPLCTQGWHGPVVRDGHRWRLASRSARITVFNPDETRPLTLTVKAMSLEQGRTVLLRAGERRLCSWHMIPDRFLTFVSPSFTLPSGLSELAIDSDGACRPGAGEWSAEGDKNAYSLGVSAVQLVTVDPAPASTASHGSMTLPAVSPPNTH